MKECFTCKEKISWYDFTYSTRDGKKIHSGCKEKYLLSLKCKKCKAELSEEDNLAFGGLCQECYEKYLTKSENKILREYDIEQEMDRIRERQYNRQIKERAEKRIYGKVKTKRVIISQEDKEEIFDKFNNECATCGAKQGLHIHHKDHDPSNNKTPNLIVLCGVCHKKLHMKVR